MSIQTRISTKNNFYNNKNNVRLKFISYLKLLFLDSDTKI